MGEEAVRLKWKDKNRRQKTKTVFGYIGFFLSLALLIGLTVNALLCIFAPHYYPTFGGYRLFSIVSDSMEPEIPKGHMIVGSVPKSEDEIGVGTVITYEWRQEGAKPVLITHRVIAVHVSEATGIVSYSTQGDNAGGVDAVRPAFSDVVGVYTGKSCAFFGYFFGFLQSSAGAIALIVILLIVVVTAIIIHFVNLVSMWRSVALGALKKSGYMLGETQNEGLGVIADVIGIVSKEPIDKADIRRKDKKLAWFIKTGRLPKRPYSDDLDEKSAAAEDVIPALSVADDTLSEQEAAQQSGRTVYRFTLTAKLMQLNPDAKEWYSRIKNELLSYEKTRVRMGNRYELFSFGRTSAARIGVRGKTLCLYFAGDPAQFENTKYAVKEVKSSTPCLYKIRSARRVKYACELLGLLMQELGARKKVEYEAQDFRLPYEDTDALIGKGLVKKSTVSSAGFFALREEAAEESAPDGDADDNE